MITLRRLLIRVITAAFVAVFLLLPAQQAHADPTGGIGGYCSPGQWTQVFWHVHPAWPEKYRFQVYNDVQVNWRRFSTDPSFYWEGSFTTQGEIWSPPSWYTSIEFMCSTNSPVWVTPLPFEFWRIW